MERNRKNGLRSKQDEHFEPAKLNGKRRQPPEALETLKPLRRSARLRERKLNQETPYINRALRPPLQPAKICANRKPKQLQPKRQNIKRQKGKIIPTDADKPPQKDGAQESTQSKSRPQNESIKNWISACAHMAEREDTLPNPSEDMPQSARSFNQQGGSRSTSAIAPSNAMRPSFINAQVQQFETLLDECNIHIDDEDAPSKLIDRAKEIILPPDSSFEMDDVTAEELKRKLKSIRNKKESVFVRDIGSRLFPAMINIPDQRLAAETDTLWNQAVTIEPDPVPLLIQRKLPRPKPDLAFAYSGAAFDKNQNMAIGLLSTGDERSYAKPVETLRFPFLQIEFKSISSGNMKVAENQVANGGAITMRGLLELYRRISAEKDIDMDMPQFFSLCLDQNCSFVNVHWLSYSADNMTLSFHMVRIGSYFMDLSKSLKEVHQIVKNILDYGLRERLPRIRKALDKYYQDSILERETAIHRRDSESQAEEQPIPPRQLDDPSVDRRPARRRKLGRPAREEIAEGSVDGPAEQLQRRRAKRATTKKTTPSVLREEKVPVRASSRIADLARSRLSGQDT